MTNLEAALRALTTAKVDFIIVGGVAAAIHGSVRGTSDADFVYSRSAVNLSRLAAALEGAHPYLRGAPPGLPFRWDLQTLRRGLNFTLVSDFGDLDLLGEIAGGGTYENLRDQSSTVRIFGIDCRCLDLDALIRVKRAAGRPKDLEAIAELERILELRKQAE
jgi:predicted nucleotidyltransferase